VLRDLEMGMKRMDTSWREHDEDEEPRVVRDRGTWLERAVGWVLTYPVRSMIAMLAVVLILTFICGL
jgi:hypothetical protein